MDIVQQDGAMQDDSMNQTPAPEAAPETTGDSAETPATPAEDQAM